MWPGNARNVPGRGTTKEITTVMQREPYNLHHRNQPTGQRPSRSRAATRHTGAAMRRIALLTASLTTWLAVHVTTITFAASGDKIGQNLGDMLGGWAKSLYAGIAALIAVMFLVNRRFTELGVFIVAAVIVGGFVLAPGSIATTVRDIWHGLTA